MFQFALCPSYHRRKSPSPNTVHHEAIRAGALLEQVLQVVLRRLWVNMPAFKAPRFTLIEAAGSPASEERE